MEGGGVWPTQTVPNSCPTGPAACPVLNRLMDRSVDSEEQLWMVARVMSGEEYAQASVLCLRACRVQQQQWRPA